jgi:autotransporter strand-loop-strand O-heptosyltransferase
MKDPKVYAHAAYVGTTGYNNHTRDFFRHLSKLIDIKVRNYTVTSNWVGNTTDEQHNNEPWINETDKKLLIEQTLHNPDGGRSEFPLYKKYHNKFNHNINLVLAESKHHYFHDEYIGPKIAYNVWESTRQPDDFFKKLLEYDQIWVASKWQAKHTIEQGANPSKVKVVPEGVDVSTFYPEEVDHKDYDDDRFKFILFGRWDYRKSTKEIIQTFLNTFSKDEPIDLIISIDNPWSGDGFKTTEERLKHHKLDDDRIKIKHFPSREDYVKYLKKGHVFLSCARSEGWNLPLIEAMACGTPSIYSADSGQMEFAEGKGLPVKVKGKRLAKSQDYQQFSYGEVPGHFPEPDFDDLKLVMRDAYENYKKHKKKALKDAKIIHKEFNWDNVAKIGMNTLQDFLCNFSGDGNKIDITYNNGPKVEIIGDYPNTYNIEFIDSRTNKVIYDETISNNMWVCCSKKYYIPWIIKINGKVVEEFNLNNKNVLISFESSAIGDTIAWFPYIEEFRKKHKCNITCKTWWNDWFKEDYPEISFVNPEETIMGGDICYKMGWFYNGEHSIDWDGDYHPNSFLPQPLQKTASDILGLEYKEIKPSVKSLEFSSIKEKYVTVSIQSTSQCKYWNYPNGWEEVLNYLKKKGYKTVSVDKHSQFGIKGVINNIPKTDYNYNNKSLDEVMSIIKGADLHLGIGSGLSWMAWALDTPVVLITSFSKPFCEFKSNCLRIYNDTPTSGYFNYYRMDPNNWNWYPYKDLNTHEDWYEVENITPDQVINSIKKFIKL